MTAREYWAEFFGTHIDFADAKICEFAEAYAAIVSSKAAEAPGGREEQLGVCDQGFAGRLPHPKDCHLTGPCVNWTTWAAPAAPSEREIPWDKLKPLMNVVCDGYGISHYPEEAPGDFDFCEGSIAWLAVEAYRIGRAGLSSQEGK